MSISKPAQPLYCKNCDTKLPAKAVYCPNCSQRYRKGKISFFEMIIEFLETIFNIDNKIFRTLAYMLIPGKLTLAYVQGRQIRFIHPMRLFLVAAILFFSVLSFLIFRYEEREIQKISEELLIRDGYKASFLDELDQTKLLLLDSLPWPDSNCTHITLDTFLAKVPDPRKDSIDLTYLDWHRDSSFTFQRIKVSKRDLFEVPVDEIPGKYGIEGLLGATVVKQLVKLQLKLGQFIGFAVSQTVWTFLILMPLLAFFLKFLYIRHRIYFVEHLVFSFHFHAFVFIFTAIMLLGAYWINQFSAESQPGSFLATLFLTGLVYLWLSMKRLYRQRFWKTTFKFFVFSSGYMVLFSICLILSLFLATILF